MIRKKNKQAKKNERMNIWRCFSEMYDTKKQKQISCQVSDISQYLIEMHRAR